MSSRQAAIALAGVWALAVCVRAGAQQQPPTPPAAAPPLAAGERSTLAGVYTAKQAEAGQTIFEATCLGTCHSLNNHRGDRFKNHWAGKYLWALFERVSQTMPDDDPGSLTNEQSIQVVAYLLKLNGLPEGKDELPFDEAALKKIKVELPPEK